MNMIAKAFNYVKRKRSRPIVSSVDNDEAVEQPSEERQDKDRTRQTSQVEDISTETLEKTRFAINNSVLGVVRNINGVNVSSYSNFIERYFPINEEDWKELKQEIQKAASKGPKISLKILGGEIDQKERKRDGLTLIAFIKDNLTGDPVSGEIHGNITRLEDKVVFHLEDNLQLPTLQDCVLRIEIKKVKGDALGITEIPLETIDTTVEEYYPVFRQKRISLSGKQEHLGKILLNIRKDFSEEDPNVSVPYILKEYFIKRLNQVLKKDLHQTNSTFCPVSYTVTATRNAVGIHPKPYQRLVSKDRYEEEGERCRNKFQLTCILSDELELGLEPSSPLSLGGGGGSERRLSPHRMMSVLSGGMERRISPSRLLENVMDSVTSRNQSRHLEVSSLLPTLFQHKPTHSTIPGESQVSWDVQLAVSSEVLFSIEELGNLHQHFILRTIEELAADEFDGKLSRTDQTILRILTGFIDTTSQEIQLMISHSFISSYNKLPFNEEIISKHVKIFAASRRKTEAVCCFIKSLTNIIEDHSHSDENLVFAVKNLKVLKEINILNVENLVVSVEKWVENSFYSVKNSMEMESKLAVCRDFLISHVLKELLKDEKRNYQELFAGLLDYCLVTGDKYLSLCRDLLKSHLPVNPGLPLKYSEKKPEVNDLRVALDTFYTMKRIWRVVHPEKETAQWIFDLYQEFPVKWISLATLKAGIVFENLEEQLQQNLGKFGASENPEELSRSISQEENNIIDNTLQVIYGTIEGCWRVRDELVWRDPVVNLRTGNILITELNRFESSILRQLEEIHLRDQKYEAYELAAWIVFLEGLLKRHEVTITEISKLRHEVSDIEVTSCIDKIDSIRTDLNDKIDEKIQVYVEGMRKQMRNLIDAKQLINVEDNANEMTLMKCLDDECRVLYNKLKKSSSNSHCSQAILALWKVVEEELLEKLNDKKERNLMKNKPERFNLLKKTIELLIDEKRQMEDNAVINDLELDRLDKMLAEVLVLSEQTSTLISKVFTRKADATNIGDSLDQVELDSIKLKLKLAVSAETVILRFVHVTQVGLNIGFTNKFKADKTF